MSIICSARVLLMTYPVHRTIDITVLLYCNIYDRTNPALRLGTSVPRQKKFIIVAVIGRKNIIPLLVRGLIQLVIANYL